jgi:hypothetical protein
MAPPGRHGARADLRRRLDADLEPGCATDVNGCVSLDRTEYDHRVATVPAQTIPFATLTAVTTPAGTYDLLWATTSETNIKHDCPDTAGYTNDDGFVATRRAP